ncbi:hypothetical protein [Cryptosporangium sp. NPDC048952]|uniref:hypothetical protein n=1 Tax=Cryptosporangium sp. NPDC048952 TaxID=3363961 RepID=UPI0037180DEF
MNSIYGIPWSVTSEGVRTTATVAAVLIALTSLLISWKSYRRAAARPVVSQWKAVSVNVGGHPSVEKLFHVVVQNQGGAAITVRDVGLVEHDGNRRMSARSEEAVGRQIQGPPLPYRLESNDLAEWGLTATPHPDFSEVALVKGYVEVGKKGRIHRRGASIFREIVAPTPEQNAG